MLERTVISHHLAEVKLPTTWRVKGTPDLKSIRLGTPGGSSYNLFIGGDRDDELTLDLFTADEFVGSDKFCGLDQGLYSATYSEPTSIPEGVLHLGRFMFTNRDEHLGFVRHFESQPGHIRHLERVARYLLSCNRDWRDPQVETVRRPVPAAA